MWFRDVLVDDEGLEDKWLEKQTLHFRSVVTGSDLIGENQETAQTG